jgi:mono/diheme cytochrome c family protein
MGQIEFESDRFEQALDRFKEAGLEDSEDGPLLRASAMTLALLQQPLDAERLLARADAAASRPRRINELRTRLAFTLDDQQAEKELDSLLASLFTPAARPQSLASGGLDGVIERSRAAGVSELYLRHCAACHGDRGHEDGRAAQHLFPRPPSLRDERFRLVSTVNGVATIDDLVAVIGRGVPGTSMPPYDGPTQAEGAVGADVDIRPTVQLTAAEQRQLAEEVWQMHRDGVRQRLISAMQDAYEDEGVDEDEIDQLVRLHTRPAEAVRVPQIGAADVASIARGKEAYFQLGCEKCHGDNGTGAPDNPLFDHRGLPALPRDLVHDPFKGGHEPQAVYLRLYVGMPGTHHPNSSAVPENQLVDLVQYCRQLASQPGRSSTNYERFHRAARRDGWGSSEESAADSQ